jgi:hypothetical protein
VILVDWHFRNPLVSCGDEEVRKKGIQVLTLTAERIVKRYI